MKEEETNDWDLAGHQLGPWVTQVRHRERDEALDWPLSRVAERNLTSPPSQIRTGHSRVIRLLPPSLRPHTLFPQDK
jgi:hypothetical protein